MGRSCHVFLESLLPSPVSLSIDSLPQYKTFSTHTEPIALTSKKGIQRRKTSRESESLSILGPLLVPLSTYTLVHVCIDMYTILSFILAASSNSEAQDAFFGSVLLQDLSCLKTRASASTSNNAW